MPKRNRFASSPIRDLRVGLNERGREIGYVREYDRSTPWIQVGTAGAPAFQNGWTNYSPGSGYTPLRFMRSASGIVYIEGMLTGTGSGLTVFTLFDGFRPLYVLNMSAVCFAGGVYGPVEVTINGTTGQVTPNYFNGPGAWVSLSTLAFPAEQ